MRQQTTNGGRLFLLGGDKLRFLVEEPVRMRLDGLQVVGLEHDRDFEATISEAVDSMSPACLVVNADSLSDNLSSWISKFRNRYQRLPIVALDTSNSRLPRSEFIPQLVEPVAIIQYPYTQTAVIDAIEKSFWWSLNLCRMLERVEFFNALTERELAIVSLATDGVPNKSMASRLQVSIKTIEKNRRTAYEKLKIVSSAEMAALVTFRRYFNRSFESRLVESPPVLNPTISIPTSITMPIQIVD